MASTQSFIFKCLLAAFVGLAALYAVIAGVFILLNYKSEKQKGKCKSLIDFFSRDGKWIAFNKTLDRITVICLSAALGFAFLGLGTLKYFTAGPSQAWNNSFSNSLEQSRRFKFLTHLFLTDEEQMEVLSYDAERKYPTPVAVSADGTEEKKTRLPERFTGTDDYGLEFNDGISYFTTTYKNSTFYVITIADPKRVFVGLSSNYPNSGQFLEAMVNDNNALGGVNAGSFLDYGGGGSGGEPNGITIINGSVINGNPNGDVAGLDENGILYVGFYDYDLCAQFGFNYAVSFGPVLIANGEISDSSILEAGNNPRTAIGQREDDAIVLLCVDGRQSYSDGVSQRDVADFLKLYDVKNAINMDGGSSTCMFYEGELKNHPTTAMNGTRYLPTAWLFR